LCGVHVHRRRIPARDKILRKLKAHGSAIEMEFADNSNPVAGEKVAPMLS